MVRHGTLDVGRIFVLPQTLVNDLTKQVILCPGQVFDPVFASSCGAGTAATRSNPIPRTSLDDTVTRRALSIGARGLSVPAAIAARSI